MSEQGVKSTADCVVDDDMLQLLAESQDPVPVAPDDSRRIRTGLMARIRAERQAPEPDLVTIRAEEGEWTEVAPKARIKVLSTDPRTGALSYLLRLEPGFEYQPHGHAIDEECLVLEGEFRIGECRLKAGDYHLAPEGTRHERASTATGALLFIRGPVGEVASAPQ